jgi:hypothetical protein
MNTRLEYLIACAAAEAYHCRARADIARAYDDVDGLKIARDGEAAWVRRFEELTNLVDRNKQVS